MKPEIPEGADHVWLAHKKDKIVFQSTSISEVLAWADKRDPKCKQINVRRHPSVGESA